jgi:hypothetical protein
MPDWANVIWGTALILVMLVGREFWKRIENPTAKAIAGYVGFGLLLALAVMLPVLGFRYSPYKFSIYTPFAGLLLATPTIEVMDKGISLLRDLRRRIWLRRPLPARLREALRDILKPWSSEKRLERALHFVQMQFHTACAVLFNEASERDIIGFDILCIASPTPGRVAAELGRLTSLDQAPLRARQAAALVLALNGDPVLREAMRLSRSLYVATNEIRRQRAALDEEELESSPESVRALPAQADDSTSRYTDLMVKTLTMEGNAEQDEEFNRLYNAIAAYAARAAEIMRDDDALPDLLPAETELFPYAIRRRCTVHGREELFIYFNEQEDANNRDDFFDIVYGGETIACQPDEHPGLTKFREYVAQALAPGD